MKLENIKLLIEDKRSKKALELLPKGAINENVEGSIRFCEGLVRPTFQIFITKNFDGVKSFSDNYYGTSDNGGSRDSFATYYKGNLYAFIDKRDKKVYKSEYVKPSPIPFVLR